MMSGAQLHLALNHLPVVSALLGFLILLVGMVFKNLMIKRTALAVMVFAAISVAPVYLSGEPAEEIVEHKPGVTKALIHEHEEAAELSLVFTLVAGGVAALGLILGKMKREKLETKTTYAALALSIVTFGLLANTAHLGGMIRHDELRSPSTTPAASVTGEGEKKESGEKENDGDDD